MLKLLSIVYCKNIIHLLDRARPTMHVNHSTIITVGVIILFFYMDLCHVSKLHNYNNVNVFSYAEDVYSAHYMCGFNCFVQKVCISSVKIWGWVVCETIWHGLT